MVDKVYFFLFESAQQNAAWLRHKNENTWMVWLVLLPPTVAQRGARRHTWARRCDGPNVVSNATFLPYYQTMSSFYGKMLIHLNYHLRMKKIKRKVA